MPAGEREGSSCGLPADGARVRWIDTARGIGILLVVYGHVMRAVVFMGLGTDDAFFERGDALIYAFHMPLFFLISGLVTRAPRAGERARFAGDRFLRIAYPYFLWSLIYFFMVRAAGGMANHPLDRMALVAIGWEPIAHFWFLYVLFFCNMVLLLPGRWSIVPLVVLGMAASLLHGAGPMPLRICYFLPFFALGFLLTRDRAAALLTTAGAALRIGAAGWLLFVFGFLIMPMIVPATARHLLFFSTWLTGIGGTVGTIALARLVGSRSSILEALGRASLPIYLLHPIVSAIVRGGLLRFHLALAEPVWIGLLMLAGIVVPYCVYQALCRLGLDAVAGLGAPARAARLSPGDRHLLEPTVLR